MDLSTYQELAKRTATHPDPNADMYELMALGLIGETGEVVDLIKKHKYHNVPIDVEKLKKEVGDCLWYLANGLTLCYVDLGMLVSYYIDTEPDLIHMALICGEIADSLCDKTLDQYTAFPRSYLAQLHKVSMMFGFTLGEAADCNIEKLKRRYPDGFDLGRAANHDSE